MAFRGLHATVQVNQRLEAQWQLEDPGQVELCALLYHRLSRHIFLPSIGLMSYFQEADVSGYGKRYFCEKTKQIIKQKQQQQKNPNIGRYFLKLRDEIALL